MSRKRRIVGSIDKLQPALKDTVDQMLMSGESYREIRRCLAENEVILSQASVCRYAKRFLANAEQLRIAQENFRMILTETERYPNLDPTDILLLRLIAYTSIKSSSSFPASNLIPFSVSFASRCTYTL